MNVSPKIKKVVACFVLMLMTCQFVLTMTNGIANAAGGPYLVTVKWTIPSDYTIQIGYVTGKGEIDFTSFTKKNGTIGADSQVTTVGSRVYAMNITNVGNTNVYVHANFTNQSARWLPQGVVSFNMTNSSIGGSAFTHRWYWGQANGSANQTISTAALAQYAQAGYWAWSSITNAGSTASTTVKLRLVSCGS